MDPTSDIAETAGTEAEDSFLAAYLRRIGFQGDTVPTLAALRQLHALHPRAIAFENLSPLLGQPVSLAPQALSAKLVAGGRGGYCYEQNLVFARVLRRFGFQVRGLAARVLWQQPPPAQLPPRTHMLLLVELAGEAWIADVGFGGLTQTAPLKLLAGREQETPHERFRLLESGRLYRLEARVSGLWRPLYAFDLQEQLQGDYELANWYVSTHPESRFTRQLLAARPGDGCRHALLNLSYSCYGLDGGAEQRRLDSPAELENVLAGVFGLRLDGLPVAALFARLQAAGEATA